MVSPAPWSAQAWLDRDDASEVLAKQAAFPLVRSVRHKPKARRGARDAGAARRARWTVRAGAGASPCSSRHGLHFDLQTPWWHFDAAAELARDFPATTIIVNHTGLPADRSAEGLAGWRRAMELLAARPT